MITIFLHNLKFTGFHGVYEEEKLMGNEFEVNVDIGLEARDRITALHQTANYATVYEVIKQRMARPSALLETVAQDLADLIFQENKIIKSVTVSIKKISPPIMAFQGVVGVSFKKEF